MRNKKLLCIVLILVLAMGVMPFMGFADEDQTIKSDNIVILYTGNLRGSTTDNIGLDGLVAYRNERSDAFEYVDVVDSGNALRGTMIANATDGRSMIDAMNVVKFTVSVPGKDELEYGVDSFLLNSKNAKHKYISANLYDSNGNRVLDPYKIVTYGSTKVAYVGVTGYDAIGIFNGSYTVSKLAASVQEAIDAALAKGANYVIALGNVTADDARTLIKSVSGLNCFINSQDEAIIGEKVTDKASKSVILTSAGSRLENIGVLTIYTGTLLTTQLLSGYNAKNIAARDAIDEALDSETTTLKSKIGSTAFVLNAVAAQNQRIVESQETNLGDLVTDAVKVLTSADVALIPAADFAGNILVGDISYSDILEALPYNKEISVVEMKGSDLMDALEMSTRYYPSANKDFFQVSGVTIDISESAIPSVKTDYAGNFVSVEDDYRIGNVKVGGVDISLYKTYKVATTNEVISGATGYTMFKNAKIINKNVTMANDALAYYLMYGFSTGVASFYSQPLGRIDSYVVVRRSEYEAAINSLAEQKVKNYVAQLNNLKADMEELNEIYALTTMEVSASSSFYVEGGKRKIKVTWKTSEAIDGLSYEVYRSTSKSSGYSKKFTTKNLQYTNTSGFTKGKTYYYKVRAYKTIKGKTYYTEWSNIAYRKVTK